MQAVVEGRDHLVFTIKARVHAGKSAQAVEAKHREVLLLQGAEVSAGALDPEEFNVLACDGVLLTPLGRGVATGVVRDPRVGTETVGKGNQVSCCRVRALGWSLQSAPKYGGRST